MKGKGGCEDGLASIEEINYVAILLEQYIRDYVKKIGGVSKTNYIQKRNVKKYSRGFCNYLWNQKCGEAKT